MNIGLSRFFERECARVWTHSQINPVNPGDPSIYNLQEHFTAAPSSLPGAGALPPCLFEMEHLTHLALSDNHLTGSIPKIYAKELVVLALMLGF